MADPRQWRDIASTTRYPFLPTAPSVGTGSAFPEALFADVQASCPGGRLLLTSYSRTVDGGISGVLTTPDGWTASFSAASASLDGGWSPISESSTGKRVGVIVFCKKAGSLIDSIGLSPNRVDAEIIPTLLSDSTGGVTSFVATSGLPISGNITIETEPAGVPEGIFIETSGGLNPSLMISAAGVQDYTPCGRTALRTINGVPPDSYGDLVLQVAAGSLTGVLRILPGPSAITFTLETS